MKRWKDREDVAAGKNISVLNQVYPEGVSVVSENREYIKLLLQYHIFFVKNELAQCKAKGTIAPERYPYIQTVIKVYITLCL